MTHEETSLQTKRMLAASLRKIMAQKLFSKITVSEIIADCGVNRKTFYYHFKNTNDLLHWMLDQESIEIVKHFDLLDNYHGAVAFVMDYIEGNQQIIKYALDPVVRDELHDFFVEDCIGIADSVLHGMEEKYGGKLSDEFREFAAGFFCEAVSGMIITWIRNNCKNREFVQESITTVLSHAFRGIARLREQE